VHDPAASSDLSSSDPVSSPHAPRKGLGRATPVAFIATALPILGSVATLSFGPYLAPWLRDQGSLGLLYFTLTFAIAGALTLAPTYTTSVIAGYTFGFARGFPAVVVGTVGGAVLCYLFAKWFAKKRVEETFHDHPRWDLVRQALVEEDRTKALWIVFLMRLSPILPFGTTNVLLATAGVPLNIYTFGTILGLAPRLGLVALAAAGADRLDFDSAESWWLLGAGLVATGICIAVMAMIGRRALKRATRER
jgi:uncharacterized membrane protein YdjX (TVP38/TMEM64 family)